MALKRSRRRRRDFEEAPQNQFLRHPAFLGVLFGIVVTVAGSVTPVAFKDDLLAGLIGVAIGMVLELRIRGEHTERRQDGISQLLATLDRLPEHLVPATQQRLKTYAEAARMAKRVPLYSKVLTDRMNELQKWLEEVVSGRIMVGHDQVALLNDGLRQAKVVLAITGSANTVRWWFSPAGQSYWTANTEAIRRGVRIRRIFVEEPSLTKGDRQRLRKLIAQHLAAGVESYYIEASRLTARGLDFADITIFDQILLHRSARSAGEHDLEVLYSINPDDIRRAQDQFEIALGLASEIRPDFFHDDDNPDLPAEAPLLNAEFEPSTDTALAAELLRLVFRKAMPPAFVKVVTPTSAVHILESEAFEEFQHSSVHSGLSEAEAAASVVRADHQAGDLATLHNGVFRQVELAEARPGERSHAILTTKTLVRHRGQRYIVGWYVPVDTGQPQNSPTITLAEDRHQITYSLCPASPGQGIDVHLGEALRG